MDVLQHARRLLSRRSDVVAPASATSDLYTVRSGADVAELAAQANSRFERLYYEHSGRVMFKWRQYLPIYEQVLSPYVGRPVTLVEIGVAQGGSLQLWRKYLGPASRIIGVDLMPDAARYAEPGIEVLIGDQGDKDFLQRVLERAGHVDIVIDDGSHQVAHQRLALETFFPRLNEGGVFVCEDLHTSYWEGWGGGLQRPGSFIEYLKTLVDMMHAPYRSAEVTPEWVNDIGSIVIGDSIAALSKRAGGERCIVQVGQPE